MKGSIPEDIISNMAPMDDKKKKKVRNVLRKQFEYAPIIADAEAGPEKNKRPAEEETDEASSQKEHKDEVNNHDELQELLHGQKVSR